VILSKRDSRRQSQQKEIALVSTLQPKQQLRIKIDLDPGSYDNALRAHPVLSECDDFPSVPLGSGDL